MCGFPGTGKTTLLIKMIKKCKEKVLIFDINSEKDYKQFKEIKSDEIKSHKQGIARVTDLDFNKVLKILTTDFKNGLLILDDSNYYLTALRNNELWKILVSRRHLGIDIILTFQSLNRMPQNIIEMINYIILFKTSDSTDKINKRFEDVPKVLETFLILQKHSNRYQHYIINIM